MKIFQPGDLPICLVQGDPQGDPEITSNWSYCLAGFLDNREAWFFVDFLLRSEMTDRSFLL